MILLYYLKKWQVTVWSFSYKNIPRGFCINIRSRTQMQKIHDNIFGSCDSKISIISIMPFITLIISIIVKTKSAGMKFPSQS